MLQFVSLRKLHYYLRNVAMFLSGNKFLHLPSDLDPNQYLTDPSLILP